MLNLWFYYWRVCWLIGHLISNKYGNVHTFRTHLSYLHANLTLLGLWKSLLAWTISSSSFSLQLYVLYLPSVSFSFSGQLFCLLMFLLPGWTILFWPVPQDSFFNCNTFLGILALSILCTCSSHCSHFSSNIY